MTVDIRWVDSTTIAIHRHGSGASKKEALYPVCVMKNACKTCSAIERFFGKIKKISD
jgi:hypothetical protein